MSFSQARLVNALRLLSGRLPEFSEQQTRVDRLLRIVTERPSDHLNENLKVLDINENLWSAVVAVCVSSNNEVLSSRLGGMIDLIHTSATRLSDEMVERGWVERHISQQGRRRIVLKLTPEGEAFIQKVRSQVFSKSGEAWQNFTNEDYVQLQYLLNELLGRLEG